MTSGPSDLIASAPRTELETLFAFLGRIRDDAGLREQINWMQTVLEVSDLAGQQGQPFRPELLVAVLERCSRPSSGPVASGPAPGPRARRCTGR